MKPEFEKLEELAKKATPGPWTAHRMIHAETGEAMTPEDLGEYVKNSVLKSFEQSKSMDYLFVSCTKEDGDYDLCHVGNGPASPYNTAFIAAANPTTILSLLSSLREKEREIEGLRQGKKEAEAVNEADRCKVADGITLIENALKSREWLRLGRGSYEWNDDRWKDEFGAAIGEIFSAIEPLRRVAADRNNCPQTTKEVFAARSLLARAESAELRLSTLVERAAQVADEEAAE